MAWKEYCGEYWLKEDSCTGRHDIIKILLNMTLNTIQSIIERIGFLSGV